MSRSMVKPLTNIGWQQADRLRSDPGVSVTKFIGVRTLSGESAITH
jgi:hypothetical protein